MLIFVDYRYYKPTSGSPKTGDAHRPRRAGRILTVVVRCRQPPLGLPYGHPIRPGRGSSEHAGPSRSILGGAKYQLIGVYVKNTNQLTLIGLAAAVLGAAA